VSGRVASATSQFIFRGPAAIDGLENIQNISDSHTGLSSTFNYWTWRGETFKVQNASSIALYGIKKRQIDSGLITNTTKQQNILAALNTEFGEPKEQFRIKTPITYDNLELFYLDKVNVDYPTVYYTVEGQSYPIYEISKYDEAVYPTPESLLEIDVNRNWKILGVNILVKDQILEFNIKEV